jgi:hypothetical protein
MIRIPERIENLYISVHISPHLVFRDYLPRRVPHVDRRSLRLKVMEQPVGRYLATPKCVVALNIRRFRAQRAGWTKGLDL